LYGIVGILRSSPSLGRTARICPLEFSRVSNDGRLTLVIDEIFGVPCATYSAVSACDNLKTAIENLRDRERMLSTKGVGFIDLSSNSEATAR
jgi:hypothetical protein